MAINLQRFMDVSEAGSRNDFRRQILGFAEELGFGLACAVLVTEMPGRDPYVVRVGNTPDAFQQASQDPSDSSRDPVMRRLKKLSVPFVYDQSLYVREHAADLWEQQAAYGYKTGINVALHLPGNRHFLLGMDRDVDLPRSDLELTQLLANLQLLAVHAQDAALRLWPGVPEDAVSFTLTRREREVLRATMQGKTAKQAGDALFCSEHTVNFHLREIRRKLNVATKHEAVLKALDLKLL